MFEYSYLERTWRRTRVLASLALPFIIVLLSSPAFAGSVTLAWDPSASTDVSAYSVRYGTVAGQYTSSTDVGQTTNAVISGLQDGVTYYFVATAFNSGGVQSDPSNEVGFTVSVQATNALAITAIANQTSLEDSTATVPFAVSTGSGSFIALNLTGFSSNTNLVSASNIFFTGAGSSRTATITPWPNRSGSTYIEILVSDGVLNARSSFWFTVNPVNDAPTLSGLSGRSITQNAGAQTIILSGIGSGAADEVQPLTVTALSSNPGLIPNPSVNYLSPNSTGTLTFTPVANGSGSSTISVTVNDGQGFGNLVTRNFTLTVTATNPPPTIVLSSPASGASFTAPATIDVIASVTAGGYTIAKVQFYNGLSLLGEDIRH